MEKIAKERQILWVLSTHTLFTGRRSSHRLGVYNVQCSFIDVSESFDIHACKSVRLSLSQTAYNHHRQRHYIRYALWQNTHISNIFCDMPPTQSRARPSLNLRFPLLLHSRWEML